MKRLSDSSDVYHIKCISIEFNWWVSCEIKPTKHTTRSVYLLCSAEVPGWHFGAEESIAEPLNKPVCLGRI